MVSVGGGRDIKISGYVDNTSIVDTVLTGRVAKHGHNFLDRVKKMRVPMILSGKLIVNTDSALLQEIVMSYFVKGIPVKVEVFHANGKKQCSISGNFSEQMAIYKSYFTKDGPEPYQVDTIWWNADTTLIKWSSTRFEWPQTFVSAFTIRGNRLNMTFNDSSQRTIDYLDNKVIFRNLLTDNFIYNDVLYYIELHNFEREKILRVATGKQITQNDYIVNRKKQIVKQKVFYKGRLQRTVRYRYKK